MGVENKREKIGYCRPPMHSRWQKGQSGNPKGRRSMKSKRVSEIVEAELSKSVLVTENGGSRHVTYFEAIVLQLCMKVSAGSSSAFRVLQKYRAFAVQRPEYREMTAVARALAVERYAAFRVSGGNQGWPNMSGQRNPILPTMTAKEAAEAYRLTLERDRHGR
jgi:hypothetical protein